MTGTLALSVPEAAARLDRSERTIWRQIRSGELRTRRDGRRVLVLLAADAPGPRAGRAGGLRTAEAAAAYVTGSDWTVGPFPMTAPVLDRHRRARLARRRAAITEIKR